MSDPQPDLARPSFSGYWKRSKDQQAASNLTFVSSKLGQPSDKGENDPQTEPQSEAKAKARRQQVRNAQRQHRQRKANYTKQLEKDVTKLRDDIARVEEELEALRRQNGVVKSQLAGRENAAGAVDVAPSTNIMVNNMAFSTSLAPNYTVSLDMSEDLGTPTYQISRPSSSLPDTTSSSLAKYSHATETVSGTTPASTVGTSVEDVAAMESTLSEDQIDRVINFILALEHCCWNHIPQTCFEHHHHHHHHDSPQEPPHPEEMCMNKGLNGHTLMATTLALQSAPNTVFEHMSESPSAHPSPTAAGDHQLAWSTRALTLTNLRRLARTLNPSDSELAPVQAWFELASLYGVDTATNAAVLENIRRELVGKVRCVVYGAAVKRGVFEDALKKVVGFLPRSWDGAGIAYLDEEEDDMDVMMMMMEMGDDDEGEDDYDGMMAMGMGMNMGMAMGRGMGIGQGAEEDMSARVLSPQGN
ncbi:hypothetical protein F5B22DRAFT_648648 [Xylaria bambusicola]|uniref:uncharacterized protein n=1 Tax=Xylaria bambusicola TaxID=326684 RepID=UPI0020083751|nr:uncharacterized protein F5B22DRAFT_648648 [Xylaria bambusicola]KAI0512544.1 hypothetical protein F5B22DRAFT_648648 [Xylaria bambusicola]